jgi:hypothetical protein
MRVLAHRGWHGLIEVRQVVIEEVDQFELSVGALGRDVVGPLGHRFTVSARARTADDDSDLDH